jgi:thymidylate synthase
MKSYLSSSNQKPINEQVLKLLHEIKEIGFESKPRNFKCKEIFFKQLEIDPLYPIMNFNGRKFPFYYLAGEIAWYLSTDRNPSYILNFSKFWNGLKNPDGTVNSNYGNLLFPQQLQLAKHELIKDKNSRRGISFISNPNYLLNESVDFVCSMYLNFFIREDTLHMSLKMRSNDIIFGLTYDAPFFSMVLQHMYIWLKTEKYPNLKLGTYFHFADNIHFYERHFKMIDNILENEHPSSPKFEVIKPFFSYDEFGLLFFDKDVSKFVEDVLEAQKNNADEQTFLKLLSPWIKITK